MISGLLGKKVGMTQIFDEAGNRVPVSVIQAGPVTVTQKKSLEKDGYNALQVGYDPVRSSKLKNVTKALKGHFGKNDLTRYLKEFPASEVEGIEIGSTFDVSIFEKGKKVDVAGTSKGRGFTGVIKRHNFSGGPASHGHRRMQRATGSIGQSATPSRVFKNKKMAGQHGNARVTVEGLQIIDVKPELNILLIKGAIPGPNGRLVEIRHCLKETSN